MDRLVFVLMFFSSIFCISCNNDFDLNENWKDVPVTYAILNPKDTVQYVRIEKVFNDPNRSALEVAQISDSIYYDNLSVEILDLDINKSYVLDKIDGNNYNHLRDDGIFLKDPNYLYLLGEKGAILPKHKYQFIATKDNGDTLVSATTQIVDDINIYIPVSNENPVKFRNISRFNIAWDGGANSGNYDVLFVFHIKEKDSSVSDEWKDKKLVWKVASGIEKLKYTVIGKDFYVFLQSNLDENLNITRKFESFDLIVRGVGKELKEYIQVLDANLGITSSQQIPTYTNMTNGYGIFTSVNTRILHDFHLSKETRDSLRVGKFTRDLNFE